MRLGYRVWYRIWRCKVWCAWQLSRSSSLWGREHEIWSQTLGRIIKGKWNQLWMKFGWWFFQACMILFGCIKCVCLFNEFSVFLKTQLISFRDKKTGLILHLASKCFDSPRPGICSSLPFHTFPQGSSYYFWILNITSILNWDVCVPLTERQQSKVILPRDLGRMRFLT